MKGLLISCLLFVDKWENKNGFVDNSGENAFVPLRN